MQRKQMKKKNKHFYDNIVFLINFFYLCSRYLGVGVGGGSSSADGVLTFYALSNSFSNKVEW